MIVDCHYHFETKLLGVKDLLRKMDESGVEKVALMGAVNEPIPKPPEFLLKVFRFAWSHKSLRFIARLMSNNFTPEGDIKLPTGVFRLYKEPENAPVFEMVKNSPERFLGWVFVNPMGNSDPIEALDKWKDTLGFVGVKAHPFWHRYEPIQLLPVAEELAQIQKPLLIHAGFDWHGDYLALLKKVPRLKMVLAHAGFPLYAETRDRIRPYRNVYVDLSQTSYLDERMTREAIDDLGVERCLFGTDGPYGRHGADDLFDYSFIQRRIERLFPDKGILERLLGLNFMELIEQW